MKKLGYLGLAFAFPAFAFAQVNASNVSTLGRDLIGLINNVAIPFLFAVAFIVFIWGVFQYFIAGGADEEKRSQGRQFVIWSVIAFFVMSSLWGIVNLLDGTFQFGNENTPDIPTFDTTN